MAEENYQFGPTGEAERNAGDAQLVALGRLRFPDGTEQPIRFKIGEWEEDRIDYDERQDKSEGGDRSKIYLHRTDGGPGMIVVPFAYREYAREFPSAIAESSIPEFGLEASMASTQSNPKDIGGTAIAGGELLASSDIASIEPKNKEVEKRLPDDIRELIEVVEPAFDLSLVETMKARNAKNIQSMSEVTATNNVMELTSLLARLVAQKNQLGTTLEQLNSVDGLIDSRLSAEVAAGLEKDPVEISTIAKDLAALLNAVRDSRPIFESIMSTYGDIGNMAVDDIIGSYATVDKNLNKVQNKLNKLKAEMEKGKQVLIKMKAGGNE